MFTLVLCDTIPKRMVNSDTKTYICANGPYRPYFKQLINCIERYVKTLNICLTIY